MTPEEIAVMMLVAVCAASLSNLIDDCIAPEMIFWKYGNWVRSLGWYGKPIGGCLLCTNVWVSLAVYLALFGLCGWQSVVFAILFIAVSNTALKFIIK